MYQQKVFSIYLLIKHIYSLKLYFYFFKYNILILTSTISIKVYLFQQARSTKRRRWRVWRRSFVRSTSCRRKRTAVRCWKTCRRRRWGRGHSGSRSSINWRRRLKKKEEKISEVEKCDRLYFPVCLISLWLLVLYGTFLLKFYIEQLIRIFIDKAYV